MASPIVARWESRLENWAAWVVGGSRCGSRGVSSVYAPSVRHWSDVFGPQPLVGECLDTDLLVHRLSPDHQRALVANFIWTGTVADRARALGICTSTLANRVRAACFKLDDMREAQRRPTAA